MLGRDRLVCPSRIQPREQLASGIAVLLFTDAVHHHQTNAVGLAKP
jgi:hypothetical protein